MREAVYREMFEIEATHWWFRGRRRVIASLLRRWAPARRPLLLADVGCGPGANVSMLAEFGRVVAMDPSPHALAFARGSHDGQLVSAGIPHLCFADATFDVVCALDVVEHVDDDRAAARELWRVCRPGGLLVVTVPSYEWLWSEHDEANEHRRRYTRAQLAASLEAPGATVLKLSYMNTLLAPAIVAVRLVRNAARRRAARTGEPRSDLSPVAPLVNRVLELSSALEARWLPHGGFPFGTSLVYVGRKKPSR
jgi:SAM-dependent methyltransferase